MRIKMMIDRPTDKQMYWCGQVYDVPEKLAERWLVDGIAEKVAARRRIQKEAEDE